MHVTRSIKFELNKFIRCVVTTNVHLVTFDLRDMFCALN